MLFCVGIDENGLGPQLGPLIVTAVAARVTNDAYLRMRREPQSILHDRIADSKKLVGHGRIALAEAWARSISGNPPTPQAIIQQLSIDPVEHLQSSCPPSAIQQCWATEPHHFCTTDRHVHQAHEDIRHLKELGIDIVWTRCSITCVQSLNHSRRNGVSRFDVDLHAMETLIHSAREFADQEIIASCGKVGGLMRYENKFTILSKYPTTVEREHASESIYRLAGIGQIRFLRDAEDQDPLVALASLVGKWVREALMDRMVAFYQHHDPALPNASGYHDPITNQFVLNSKALRQQLGVPDDCFLREGRNPR